jgi:cytochrome c oxidase assembly factor 6
MLEVGCPYPDCTFNTADVSEALAITILKIHASGAHPSTAPAPHNDAKVEKVRRPSITTAGSSEEWSYFLSRWDDYTGATKITGTDHVVQLLECCDETLR